jgi:hypothetical protein
VEPEESDTDAEGCWNEEVNETEWQELVVKMQAASKYKTHLRSSYTGSSQATIYRKRKKVKLQGDSMQGSSDIRSFFLPATGSTSTTSTSQLESGSDSDEDDLSDGRVVLESEDYLTDKSKVVSNEERVKLQAVQQYLRLRQTGLKKGQASMQVAVSSGKSSYWGRCIIGWTDQWKANKKLVLSRRGKHPKIKNLLADSDVYLRISSWLRENKFDATPALLQKYVNQEVLPVIGVSNEKTGISLSTAARWLHALGWVRSEAKKGVYIDGHERPDVVEYRKKFLQKMEEYEPLFIRATERDQNVMHIPNTPNSDQRPIVFYTHDESIFYANDSEKVIWHPQGEMPLRKKGQGRSIMVSEFISELTGPLLEAREIICPGKSHDGYWTGKDVAEQFKKAIKIHKQKFPEYDALWAFDNSSNHNCFADDALIVSKMNLGSGGQQAKLRDTIFKGERQLMVFPDDHPEETLRGVPKGMRQVLIERNLWQEGLLKTCSQCRSHVDDPDRISCCAQRILELQPDFQGQRSLLEEIAKEQGQHIIFYPKFHCEMNFIEMYWGLAKRYTRANCDYSFKGLQVEVPKALDSIDIHIIRRFAIKSFRYMDAYRKGLTGAEAERQVKKYKSHRRIPDSWSREY